MGRQVIFLVGSLLCLCQVHQSTGQVHRNPLFSDHPCTSSQDCINFPNTECSSQTCQCKKEFVEVNDECLPWGRVGSDCKADLQCTNILGILSRCSPETKKCECYDTKSGGGKNATVVYGNTCYFRKHLGERCDAKIECQASFSESQNVDCDRNSRVCICLPGKTCTPVSAAASPTSLFNILTLIGFWAVGRLIIV